MCLSLLNEEWDIAIILDACRYDSFEKSYKRYLPKGNYKVIFMERNFSDIFQSMEKMSSELMDEEEKSSFTKLYNDSLKLFQDKEIVNYDSLLNKPEQKLKKVNNL